MVRKQSRCKGGRRVCVGLGGVCRLGNERGNRWARLGWRVRGGVCVGVLRVKRR
jgi:hypothetical protein